MPFLRFLSTEYFLNLYFFMFTTSLVFNILPLIYCAYIFWLLLISIVFCVKQIWKNCVHLQSIIHQAPIQIICLTSFEQLNHNIHTSTSSYDNIADLSRNTTNQEGNKKDKDPIWKLLELRWYLIPTWTH